MLTVSDDGSGTPVFSANGAGSDSTGLRGMTERASRWGGEVLFEPAATGSTLTVRLIVPPSE